MNRKTTFKKKYFLSILLLLLFQSIYSLNTKTEDFNNNDFSINAIQQLKTLIYANIERVRISILEKDLTASKNTRCQ